jgi:hypothetical protein
VLCNYRTKGKEGGRERKGNGRRQPPAGSMALLPASASHPEDWRFKSQCLVVKCKQNKFKKKSSESERVAIRLVAVHSLMHGGKAKGDRRRKT